MGRNISVRSNAWMKVAALFATVLLSIASGDGAIAAQDQAGPRFLTTKINVNDIKKSVDFYTQIIGYKEAGRFEGDSIIQVVLTRSGEKARVLSEPGLALVYLKKRKEPVQGNTVNNLQFVFSDVKECADKLEAAGYKLTGSREAHPSPLPVPDAPSVITLFTKDPDGIPIELIQPVK